MSTSQHSGVQTPTVSDQERRSQARKAGFASFIGTTIEWYDFYAYSTAAALVFGTVFFPSDNPALGTLASFATFWVGFLARPIGGIIFGHWGDKFGRKSALVTTLVMMGTCTALVGCLPTYAQVGALAPVLLICLRLVQGVAMGGEWGGAVVLAAEHAPKGRGVLYGAFAQQGSPMGNLSATVVWLFVSMMPDPAFQTWGWRLPFLASAVLVVIGLYVRLSVEESPAMKQVLRTKQVAKTPLVELMRTSKGIILLGVGATIIAVTATYFKSTLALSWATSTHLFDRRTFLSIITIALVVQFVVQPFGAVIADRLGDMRKTVLYLLIPELVLMPLMFPLISTGNYALAALGMAAASIPHSMYYAALAGLLAKSFPANIRYSGISLSYQLCSSVFAGTTPLIGQWLLTLTGGSVWAVVVFALLNVVVTIVCALGLIVRGARVSAAFGDEDSFSTAQRA